MSRARGLLDEGKLDEAIDAVTADLRSSPTDRPLRTFLFELLCFAGNWDRAEKQLNALTGPDANRLGMMLYLATISAEKTRQRMFENGEFPPPEATDAVTIRGTVNGREFSSLRDADPRVGARLEVFAAGNYVWIPLEHVLSIDVPPPKRLRDLLWAPATVRTGPAFHGTDLGEVLLPVLSPLTWQHPDGTVRLGRMTVWERDKRDQEVPFGQKMLLVDSEEEIPLLEVRKLEIRPQVVN
jgi:type VI secretion system protein ImpE